MNSLHFADYISLRNMPESAPIILDPVLAYGAHGLMSSSYDHVKQVMLDFYTPDELTTARDLLWEHANTEAMPKMTKRQNVNTSKGSSNTIADLLDAINALKNAKCLPKFDVDFTKLHRMPMSKPSETSNISICERL